MVNWRKKFSPKDENGLQMMNLIVENKSYHLQLSWELAYGNIP